MAKLKMEFPDRFPHHRLDAYRVALEVTGKLYRLAERLPRGHRSIADQLKILFWQRFPGEWPATATPFSPFL